MYKNGDLGYHLDKMTATELLKRALGAGEISGVQAMNKEELLSPIKQVKGIKDEAKQTGKAVCVT